MNRTVRFIMFLLPIVALLLLSTSVVFAKELSLLTISGPGVKGEMALKDAQLMMNLEKSGFFDQTEFVQPPQNLNMEAGYVITAYLNLDGEVLPYAQMTYYAADQGQPAYVHYTGRFEGQGLQPVDQWQILSRNADNTFRGLMSASDITLQPALVTVPGSAPAVEALSARAVSPVPIQISYTIAALAAGLLAFMGATMVLRRRTVNQPTAQTIE
ncbi:MAG TPA: hypothetical protein VFS61_01570 [Anaerolineales bacterium]|nr:hypothetical protein [Anaerolineales bacterium]